MYDFYDKSPFPFSRLRQEWMDYLFSGPGDDIPKRRPRRRRRLTRTRKAA